MSRSELSETTRREIAVQMAGAGAGGLVAMAARLAARYDISVSTVYAHAERRGKRRPRKAARPEYRDYVVIAVKWAHRSPEPMPLETAIQVAVEVGDLPAEAAGMPIATAQRIRRELGLKLTSKRTHRLCADYPLQAVLLDASTSQYLVVDGDEAGEGDATRLRLHRDPLPAAGYKNKPVPADRRRVLVYALWDMCTGIYRARYVVARGENALDAMDFLCWALAPGDPRVVMHGVPDDLWVDQGPLVKSAAARDLLDRLGIDIVLGAPYAKERMGGVERTHRTRWQSFERPLFARSQDAITLGELNARLVEFELREHARRTARRPVDGRLETRTAAWVPLMAQRPADNPLRSLPANPIETLAREARRKIDQNGLMRWGKVLYESADWHDCWVVARRAVDGSGDLAITNERTGEAGIARRYAGGDYNRIRAAAATRLDKALAHDVAHDDAGDRQGADIFAPKGAGNVAPMRAKAAAARPLENPLAAGDRCRDLDEAMSLFVTHFGSRLQPDEHARARALVDRTGLDRRKVVELAQTLRKAV